MPPTKRNKKGNQRGNPAARAAQPRPRPAGAAPGGAPPGSSPAPTVPPGLTSKKASPGPSSAPAVPPGLAAGKKTSPVLSPGQDLPAGLTPANNGLDLGTARLIPPVPPVTASARSAPAQPETTPADPADDVPKWAAKAVEELLTPTYWLDPGESGEPFSATIRFSGRRTDVTGKPQPRDSFWHEETVDGIIPGSGPVAITAEVRGINPGDWTVTARSVVRTGGRSYRSYPPPGHDQAGVYRVPAPRRVEIPAEAPAVVHTSTLLRSKVPGVIRFAYATLVGLGVLVGLGLEALLLSHGHYTLFRPMLFSVIAIIAGVIGGKTWYVAVHRGKKFDGWCIQGFVAGAAVVVAAAALAGPGIPAGAYLAAAAPALLIGMSIGRPGCFWAGCCTGRPTAARWGVWSSDRRLGCRRAPAQLLEALSALVSGGAVLIVVLVDGLARSGPVAVVGLAAYTVARQFILGLRAEPRVWPYGRRVTGAIAALALIAGIILLVR
ncbi:MAG TPA: prolipoprotein diacylglyceryl transferase family protein [Streptosporangiaceae bacterium]|nr:prolipoprotein diacylglyceryl transferase family protein [Streptosporangiaceae bacterium]